MSDKEMIVEEIPSEQEDEETELPIYKIAAYPADPTLEVLYQKWLRKEILIESFQRGWVWKAVQASRLVDSFLLGLPVPPIFVYKEPSSQKWIIIDGQQRLRTICGFFEGKLPDDGGFYLRGVSPQWEGKYYTTKTNLITLFHKEPQPKDAVRYMVSKWGWKDAKGRMSFRHTIAGKSDRFKVDTDGDQILIHRIGGNGIVPHWTHDDILSAAGAKLRRVLLVLGSRKEQTVTYTRVDCFEDLQLVAFIWEVCRGTVKIDFDAREMTPGSKGLRNHGTKFRVSPDDVCRLYAKKQRLS